MSRPAQFLVFSLPRCGSNVLAALLSAHPRLACVREPFNPDTVDVTNGLRTNAKDVTGINAVLDAVWSEWPVLKHVWHPYGWPFPKKPEYNRHILQRAERTVLLSRCNLLKLAMSNEIAMQTRRWTSTHDDRTGGAALESVPVNRVRRFIRVMAPALQEHRTAALRAGRSILDLHYEDVYGPALDLGARRQALANVFAFFGHSLDDDGVNHEAIDRLLDPAKSKVSSTATYLRIPNIAEIENELGTDETGWLFR